MDFSIFAADFDSGADSLEIKMATLTIFIEAALRRPQTEIDYIESEAKRDQAAEDALTLTPDERDSIEEETRTASEQAASEASEEAQQTDGGFETFEAMMDWLFKEADV